MNLACSKGKCRKNGGGVYRQKSPLQGSFDARSLAGKQRNPAIIIEKSKFATKKKRIISSILPKSMNHASELLLVTIGRMECKNAGVAEDFFFFFP